MTRDVSEPLQDLLKRSSALLKDSDVKSVEYFIDCRVWDQGFAVLCTQLYKRDVEVPTDLWLDLERFGGSLEMDSALWRNLRRSPGE